MKVTPSLLPEVLIIEPKVHGDERGFFVELFQTKRYAAAGVAASFVQDNVSRSVKRTLRGLHFQEPKGQGKLVQVLRGSVFDVAVDVRRGSPDFGRWVGLELSETVLRQLWIPPGFAHGFCVLSDSADFLYKCTELYVPEAERTIRWDDPQIGIRWPVTAPILSPKDREGSTLADALHLPRYMGRS